MKSTYLLIGFFLCSIVFFSCGGSSVNEKNDTVKVVADTVKTKTVLAENNEYIDVDSVRINGILPMVSTPKLLYATLGKPDSVGTPDTINTCVTNDKPFKYAYFKGSEFELHSETVVMSALNFKSPGTTLTAGKLTLSGNTTLAELARFFPNAVKAQSVITIDASEKVTSISVNTSKIPDDGAWILVFKDGKLIRIDSWMPC